MGAHVQPPGGVHRLGPDLVQPARDLDARVGMQDIQPAVAGMGFGDGGLERGVVGDVKPQRIRATVGPGAPGRAPTTTTSWLGATL